MSTASTGLNRLGASTIATTIGVNVPEAAWQVVWKVMPIIMISYMFAFFGRIISSFARFRLQVDLTRHAKPALLKKEWTPASLLLHIQDNEHGRLFH